MIGNFTTRDIIDCAVKLYDEEGFSRSDIRFFLECWLRLGAEFDLESVFDLIVG